MSGLETRPSRDFADRAIDRCRGSWSEVEEGGRTARGEDNPAQWLEWRHHCFLHAAVAASSPCRIAPLSARLLLTASAFHLRSSIPHLEFTLADWSTPTSIMRGRNVAMTALALAVLLCCALTAAHAYKLGDPVPMLKRAQYKGVSSGSDDAAAA